MSAWPTAPVIYELNTAAWLHDVGTRAGSPATLATVPDHEWDLRDAGRASTRCG